jgi:hypothetical protein
MQKICLVAVCCAGTTVTELLQTGGGVVPTRACALGGKNSFCKEPKRSVIKASYSLQLRNTEVVDIYTNSKNMTQGMSRLIESTCKRVDSVGMDFSPNYFEYGLWPRS